MSAPSNINATFRLVPGSNVYTSQNNFLNVPVVSYYGYAKNTDGCIGKAGPIVLSLPILCRTALAKEIKTTNEESSLGLSVNVYPNPSSNVFKLTTHTAKTEVIQLSVIDINGKVVYTTKGSPTQSFTFGEAFTNGVYLIEVRQGNEVKNVKAVKNR